MVCALEHRIAALHQARLADLGDEPFGAFPSGVSLLPLETALQEILCERWRQSASALMTDFAAAPAGWHGAEV